MQFSTQLALLCALNSAASLATDIIFKYPNQESSTVGVHRRGSCAEAERGRNVLGVTVDWLPERFSPYERIVVELYYGRECSSGYSNTARSHLSPVDYNGAYKSVRFLGIEDVRGNGNGTLAANSTAGGIQPESSITSVASS